MLDQKNVKSKGATMRLGSYLCTLKKKTKAYEAYGLLEIHERHRHRFEVNNLYRKQMEENGLVVSGENPELDLVEMIEVKEHPWYIGVQFHPELKSRIVKAHPLFRNFIAAAINQQEKEKMKSGNNYKSSVVHN
jgi:CTP synthase